MFLALLVGAGVLLVPRLREPVCDADAQDVCSQVPLRGRSNPATNEALGGKNVRAGCHRR